MRRKPALTVVYVEHGDDTLEIAGRVYFGRPGRTYGPPEDCYEGDPDEVEDISVLRRGDKLSDAVIEKLKLDWEKIDEKLIQRANDEADGFDVADESEDR